jgi:hypothetical protein
VDFLRLDFGQADLQSTVTLAATVNRIQPGSALLAAEFTQSTLAGKNVGTSADLAVEAFQLSLIDVINIDPFNTLTVPQETRIQRVTQETRVIRVDQETRTLTII